MRELGVGSHGASGIEAYNFQLNHPTMNAIPSRTEYEEELKKKRGSFIEKNKKL
jgi:hypothetical protein